MFLMKKKKLFNFYLNTFLIIILQERNKWHILALQSEQEENSDCMKPTKSFSKLMRDISSNSPENYYCFGCFHSFRCNLTLEKHTRLCKDHDLCEINLPKNNKNIKEHKYGLKSLKMNDTIYVDLECLLVKQNTCSNDPNKSHTRNIAQHIHSGYSITTLRNHSKSTKVTFYRREDCIQKLCSGFRNICT